ncbi:MAG: hypothetical protein ABMA26_25165 [Limisphaerales bacterium]
MQPQACVEEPPYTAAPPEAVQALRVVIAYNEMAAGKRAIRVMTDLGKSLGEAVEFHPLPWSFDLLSDTDWGEVAANDAIKADILIIATSSEQPLPTVVERWATDAISKKRGTPAAVVALFGPEEKPDGRSSSRMEAIRAAAHRAELAFFAPERREDMDEVIASIHQRSEMLTPVLDEILHHHPSPPKSDLSLRPS